MRIVFFGSSSFGLPSLRALLAGSQSQVVGVVTQPDQPAGRGQRVGQTPIASFAEDSAIPVWKWSSLRSPDVQATVAELQPDILLVAAYGLLIPKNILDITPQRAINIHGSLLPKYRGASPVAAAIFNGEPETGVSFMVMTPGLDDGPVIAAWPLAIGPAETADQLLERLSVLAAEHVVEVLNSYQAGRTIATQQSTTGISYAKKLTREDGRATWQDAAQEERRIRAYQPWPGAWTTWNGQRLRLIQAEADLTVKPNQPPGTVIADGRSWAVACITGVLRPLKIQRAGKAIQPAESLRSLPGWIGSRLGS